MLFRSHDAYTKLTTRFESSSATTLATLLRDAFRFKQTKEVAVHVTEWQNHVRRLNDKNITLPNEMASVMFLESLQSQFQPFYINCIMNGDILSDPHRIYREAIDFSKTIMRQSDERDLSDRALYSHSQPFIIIFHHSHQPARVYVWSAERSVVARERDWAA